MEGNIKKKKNPERSLWLLVWPHRIRIVKRFICHLCEWGFLVLYKTFSEIQKLDVVFKIHSTEISEDFVLLQFKRTWCFWYWWTLKLDSAWQLFYLINCPASLSMHACESNFSLWCLVVRMNYSSDVLSVSQYSQQWHVGHKSLWVLLLSCQ